MTHEPILQLENVTVSFDEDVIFKDVDLKIYPAETIVLIGPSGSGKTVLLKTLAGLYEPSKGTARCHGHKWQDLSIMGRHDLAQKIGMQFQKSALFDDIDVFDNVAYPLREHTDFGEEKIAERVLQCLRSVDLEKAQHLQAHELSGGMKQRLGIARAIALKPEILFMDDPTAGLDPINSDKMAELILNLKNEIGATLVIVTHDILRAYQFAGRIFLVGGKSVLETGGAKETEANQDPRVQQFLHGWQKGPLTEGSEF